MNIIVAVYSDWGIGCSGTQPIVLPEDRKFFKETTDGGTVIVGRRTFEDFGGKPLPNRRNIIITNDRNFKADGAVVVHSAIEALSEVKREDPNKVFVIGGQSIYTMLMPACKCAYVTKIELAPQSDTFFPDLDNKPGWQLFERSETFESNGVKYSFWTYGRVC